MNERITFTQNEIDLIKRGLETYDYVAAYFQTYEERVILNREINEILKKINPEGE